MMKCPHCDKDLTQTEDWLAHSRECRSKQVPDYDPELWRQPDDRIWALREAAKPSGMMPHAETTAKLLKTMELDGLVRRSQIAPVWNITDEGRAELAKLEAARIA